MTNSSKSRSRTAPMRRLTAAGVAFAAVGAVAISLVAAPAYALGGFTEKYTPTSCTETDFSGGTSLTSGNGGSGYTNEGAMICFAWPIISVRLTKGNATGPTVSTTSASVSTTISNPGTLTGRHGIAQHYRNS
jgi:hypothetical protein